MGTPQIIPIVSSLWHYLIEDGHTNWILGRIGEACIGLVFEWSSMVNVMTWFVDSGVAVGNVT